MKCKHVIKEICKSKQYNIKCLNDISIDEDTAYVDMTFYHNPFYGQKGRKGLKFLLTLSLSMLASNLMVMIKSLLIRYLKVISQLIIAILYLPTYLSFCSTT